MNAATTISLRREPGPVARSLVALLLRVGFGMFFLIAGLNKFRAIEAGKYPGMIVDSFANSPLPASQVKLFALVLPYAEVYLGAALIGGLLTTLTAALAGALLLLLLFGRLIQDDHDAGPAMMTYLLVDAAILWLSPVTSNYFSLDGLILGWFWAPKSEGTFRADDDQIAIARR